MAAKEFQRAAVFLGAFEARRAKSAVRNIKANGIRSMLYIKKY